MSSDRPPQLAQGRQYERQFILIDGASYAAVTCPGHCCAACTETLRVQPTTLMNCAFMHMLALLVGERIYHRHDPRSSTEVFTEFKKRIAKALQQGSAGGRIIKG